MNNIKINNVINKTHYEVISKKIGIFVQSVTPLSNGSAYYMCDLSDLTKVRTENFCSRGLTINEAEKIIADLKFNPNIHVWINGNKINGESLYNIRNSLKIYKSAIVYSAKIAPLNDMQICEIKNEKSMKDDIMKNIKNIDNLSFDSLKNINNYLINKI